MGFLSRHFIFYFLFDTIGRQTPPRRHAFYDGFTGAGLAGPKEMGELKTPARTGQQGKE